MHFRANVVGRFKLATPSANTTVAASPTVFATGDVAVAAVKEISLVASIVVPVVDDEPAIKRPLRPRLADSLYIYRDIIFPGAIESEMCRKPRKA